MKKICGYIRVSTDKQVKEGNSLDAQRRAITAYADAYCYELTEIYADEGISGKDTTGRADFNRLMLNAKNGAFDAILVTSLSRFSRSLSDLLQTVKLLDEYGIALISQSEGVDTTSSIGKLILGIMGSFGEYERELIRERTDAGRREKAQQGRPNAGAVLGYNLVDGEYVVDGAEADVVKFIYSEFTHRPNLNHVARLANAKGYTGKNGGKFGAETIKKLLMNPVVAGKVRHDRDLYNGNHEAIISLDVFRAVQTLLERGRRKAA